MTVAKFGHVSVERELFILNVNRCIVDDVLADQFLYVRRVFKSLIVGLRERGAVLLLYYYPLRIIIGKEVVPALFGYSVFLFLYRHVLRADRTYHKKKHQKEQQELCR